MPLFRGDSGGILNHPNGNGLMQAPTGECCCDVLGTCDCCGEVQEMDFVVAGITNNNCTDCGEYNITYTVESNGVGNCDLADLDIGVIPGSATICDLGIAKQDEIGCPTGIGYQWVIYQDAGASFLRFTIADGSGSFAEWTEEIDYQNCESSFSGNMTLTDSNNVNDCDYSSATCSVTITN